ncbi:hypothetical protein E4A47_00735 [Micrococcus flavus]|nr:hypothetical protein E4A47_00735 [Micrococcus flavus]GGK40045.1 hypothetical protein GCM10007073_03490 [Micrococcus flavus]
MTAWSDSDGYIQVQKSGSWDGVPIGDLTWARMLVFEGPIGPHPSDRTFPRTWSLEGRTSEHLHEWARLRKLRSLTLRYARPEHIGGLARFHIRDLQVWQGTGLPAATVWPRLPTVKTVSWALLPIVSLHGLKAPALEEVMVDGVRECLALEELLVSSPVKDLQVFDVRQVPLPQAVWDAAAGIAQVNWGGEPKANHWLMEAALGPAARGPRDARALHTQTTRPAKRIRVAALEAVTVTPEDATADVVRAVLPAPSEEIAGLLQRMGVTDPGVFWAGLFSVRWPCLPEAGVRIACEDSATVVRGPREAVEDAVALLAWWCSSAEVLASVVDVLVSAGLAGEVFAGGGPAVVPVSRLVTGSSVASIERLEERTYVLTMPMQPVPATPVLESRGLEHAGHTWDRILELGFPAEVRRVELDGEANVFMAYGTRPALKRVQAVLDRLTQDEEELLACLDRIGVAGLSLDPEP